VAPRPQDEIGRAKDEFAERHCALLEGVIEGELIEQMLRDIERGDFHIERHDVGVEEKMRSHGLVSALVFFANDPQVLASIAEITGCGRIGCFDGRVYRLAAARGHLDSWHNDLMDHRMVAMSVNLTPEPYEGGVLQIRDRRTGEILHEAKNAGIGDALVFRLAPELQHRVTPVEGNVARTAFAGWFKSEPNFLDVLLQRG
jgi:hypothetical protein